MAPAYSKQYFGKRYKAHEKSGPLVSCDRICQTGVLILVKHEGGSILPPPFTQTKGGTP